jgi:hypothetical protein
MHQALLDKSENLPDCGVKLLYALGWGQIVNKGLNPLW